MKKTNHEMKNEEKLAQIISLGFQPANEYLMQFGFIKLRRNLKYLKIFNGDQAKALEFLLIKQEKKNAKEKLENNAEYLIDKEKRKQERLLRRKEHKECKKEKRENYYTKFIKPEKEFRCFKYKDKTEYKDYKGRCNYNKQNNEEKLMKYSNNDKLSFEINYSVNNIILDGNNMLFVHCPIRKLCIEGKRRMAEQMLVNLSHEFVKNYISNKECNLTVIFDESDQLFDWEEQYNNRTSDSEKNLLIDINKLSLNDDDLNYFPQPQKNSNIDIFNSKITDTVKLKVLSARPNYEISDDFILDLSPHVDSNSTLFITSDKELQDRLFNNGIKYVMMSGSWFKVLLANLDEKIVNEIINV